MPPLPALIGVTIQTSIKRPPPKSFSLATYWDTTGIHLQHISFMQTAPLLIGILPFSHLPLTTSMQLTTIDGREYKAMMHLHASLQVNSPEKPPVLHRKSFLDLVVTWGDKGSFHLIFSHSRRKPAVPQRYCSRSISCIHTMKTIPNERFETKRMRASRISVH